MWLHGVVAVLLIAVALGHPHHHHHTSSSHDVRGHDWTPPPPPLCPPKSLACCDVPSLIEEADLKEAGFEGSLVPPPPRNPHHGHHGPPSPLGPNRSHSSHGPPHHEPPPHHNDKHFGHQERRHDHHHFSCEKEKCIFNKLDWLTDNTTLNTASLTAYFSEWASKNEDWLSATNQIVQNCLNPQEDEDAPPGMCVEMKTIFCSMKTLLQNCPSSAWTDSERCKSLKAASECYDRKYRPPIHLLQECCAVPDVVEKTKLTECSIDSFLPPPPPHHHHHGPPHHHGFPHNHGPLSQYHHGNSPPNGPRGPPFGIHGPDCDHHWTLFEKSGWLNQNRTLNSEGYGKHLSTWLSQHKAWSNLKDIVMETCVQDEPEIQMCLPHRILICTHRVLADNCPESSWKSSKICGDGPQQTSDPSSSEPSIIDPPNTDQDQEESILEVNIEEIEEDPDTQVENVDVAINTV